MPPNTNNDTDLIQEIEQFEKLVGPQAAPRKYQYLYFNIIAFTYWHVAALYGLYLCFTEAKWLSLLFHFVLFVAGEIGITAGAHRLWSHKTFKAKLPLEILLMVFNTLAFQTSAINWVRVHRLHHKYCDTDADPHNATRGFFYSHVGWLLVKKHDEVRRRVKTIDVSDLYNNPVLVFQKKYLIPFVSMVAFILPTLAPMYFWGETLKCAYHLTWLRCVCNLNFIFLINSAAHMWGYKPYDKSILPAQNVPVSLLTFGEGFHNYHHVFPWDYRTAELGNNKYNFTTLFIDFFTKIGWAYDLKAVNENVIKARCLRTGDGTNLWGWGDKDMSEEDQKYTYLLNVLKSP